MKSEINEIYNQIEEKILNHEVYQKVKDYSKSKEKMRTYIEIGELLNSIDTKYGKSVIKEYSNKLTIKFGKKYTVSLLYKIKQFYSIIEKVPTLSGKLTWSHWYEMLSINDIDKISYYVYQCEINHIDVRGLRNIIKSNEYERLPEATRTKMICEEKLEVKDLIPNPILIRNKNNIEIITEKLLQKLILEDIESFMKELGSSFSFIGSEYKIKICDRNNYVDLLLFNYEYNCFVVVELKVTELKKEHIGQIQVYMNYIDENLRKINQGKTIGIIICKQDNKYIIKYCSDDRIIAREYELV